jgi:hypothetical protein
MTNTCRADGSNSASAFPSRLRHDEGRRLSDTHPGIRRDESVVSIRATLGPAQARGTFVMTKMSADPVLGVPS